MMGLKIIGLSLALRIHEAQKTNLGIGGKMSSLAVQIEKIPGTASRDTFTRSGRLLRKCQFLNKLHFLK
jgi:hypothetical protein